MFTGKIPYEPKKEEVPVYQFQQSWKTSPWFWVSFQQAAELEALDMVHHPRIRSCKKALQFKWKIFPKHIELAGIKLGDSYRKQSIATIMAAIGRRRER